MMVSIVTIDPPGPLYLPISTQRNVTCSGGQLTSLFVLFSNKNSVLYGLVVGTEFATGIVITSVFPTLLISVNIRDTSVTGLRCDGNIVTVNGTIQDSVTLNITIYGKK